MQRASATLHDVKTRESSTRKDHQIRVLVTADQKATLASMAEADGLEVATWLRSIGLREAAARAARDKR